MEKCKLPSMIGKKTFNFTGNYISFPFFFFFNGGTVIIDHHIDVKQCSKIMHLDAYLLTVA